MRIYGIIKKYEKKNETFNQRSINFKIGRAHV